MINRRREIWKHATATVVRESAGIRDQVQTNASVKRRVGCSERIAKDQILKSERLPRGGLFVFVRRISQNGVGQKMSARLFDCAIIYELADSTAATGVFRRQ